MRDELKGMKPNFDECLIINHDHSSNDGTHWTCLLVKNGARGRTGGVSLYFDSYGNQPPLEVIEYCKGTSNYYSSFPIQKFNQVICGHFCVYVLYKLSKGIDIFDICDELYKYNFSNKISSGI